MYAAPELARTSSAKGAGRYQRTMALRLEDMIVNHGLHQSTTASNELLYFSVLAQADGQTQSHSDTGCV